MSFRPHGRATTDSASPRAWGVCDRCGFLFNHHILSWEYDWRGPRIQNSRFLVCPSCMDAYQQNGQRTIIIPADPVPIVNARPEYYVGDDNPLSGLGANPNPSLWQFGTQIGTMVNDAGIPAAFDGSAYKPAQMCASITVSDSSYGNYVGINWAGVPSTPVPDGLLPPSGTHSLSEFTVIAPNDTTFGSSAYLVQGSAFGSSQYALWTTISSGETAGTIGETITSSLIGAPYQFHRIAFLGDGINPIRIAQVSFSVADGGTT